MAVRMITAKWDKSNLKRKLARWQALADRELVAGVKAYGGEAAQLMTKVTPPGNGRRSISDALRGLKQRIQNDFEGDGEEPFSDKDIVWYSLRDGTHIARFMNRATGRPSPFRVIRGRVSRQVLAAMNVGRWRVEYVQRDLAGFMRSRPGQYYMGKAGRVYRMKWRGVRHVTTAAAVAKEIRRRQRRAGALMAGWKALAARAGARLPAAVMRQTGRGSARLRRDGRHGAVLSGTNSGNYRGLQAIVDRQLPGLRRRNVRLARRRVRRLAQAMGSVR